jgi:hypothetical protein
VLRRIKLVRPLFGLKLWPILWISLFRITRFYSSRTSSYCVYMKPQQS